MDTKFLEEHFVSILRVEVCKGDKLVGLCRRVFTQIRGKADLGCLG